MIPTASTKVQSYAGQFNVQVVRGRVTTRCLRNACGALALGILLLVFGTFMAIVGYYAEQLSEADVTRGNATVHVRYEARGYHLNNLSYAGPIIMGIGGFIVVAACVMTFEARDNAAKVVPARLKPSTAPSSARSTPPRSNRGTIREKRAASCQTKRRLQHQNTRESSMSRSPSAPSLVDGKLMGSLSSREFSLLNPHLLPRQALSMDCTPVDGGPNQEWTMSICDETKKKRLHRQRTMDCEPRKSKNSQKLRRSASTSTQTRQNVTESPGCRLYYQPHANPPLRRHCSVGPAQKSPCHRPPSHISGSIRKSPRNSVSKTPSPTRSNSSRCCQDPCPLVQPSCSTTVVRTSRSSPRKHASCSPDCSSSVQKGGSRKSPSASPNRVRSPSPSLTLTSSEHDACERPL